MLIPSCIKSKHFAFFVPNQTSSCVHFVLFLLSRSLFHRALRFIVFSYSCTMCGTYHNHSLNFRSLTRPSSHRALLSRNACFLSFLKPSRDIFFSHIFRNLRSLLFIFFKDFVLVSIQFFFWCRTKLVTLVPSIQTLRNVLFQMTCF